MTDDGFYSSASKFFLEILDWSKKYEVLATRCNNCIPLVHAGRRDQRGRPFAAARDQKGLQRVSMKYYAPG